MTTNDYAREATNHVAGTLLGVVGVSVPAAGDAGGVSAAATLTRTDFFLLAWVLLFAGYALYCCVFEDYSLTVTRSMREAPLAVKVTVVGFVMFLFGHWFWQ